jgi:hypothetical protein
MSTDEGPTLDQLNEFLSTGRVRRRRSLLMDFLAVYFEDIDESTPEVEGWKHFLKKMVHMPQMTPHVAPALVVADAIRGLTEELYLTREALESLPARIIHEIEARGR